MSSSYRMELDRWLSQLDVKAKTVMDIGGAQLHVEGRTKSWKVDFYYITDLPNPHKDVPKPDIEFDLNYPLNFFNMYDSVDVIFCLEVFEYVWNPALAMFNIYQLLKKGGHAWVSFPSFYPLHQPIEDDALRYMPGGIRKLANSAGLTIKQMIPRRPETNALQNFFSIERLRAAKGEDHAFMGWIVEFTK